MGAFLLVNCVVSVFCTVMVIALLFDIPMKTSLQITRRLVDMNYFTMLFCRHTEHHKKSEGNCTDDSEMEIFERTSKSKIAESCI